MFLRKFRRFTGFSRFTLNSDRAKTSVGLVFGTQHLETWADPSTDEIKPKTENREPLTRPQLGGGD